MYVCMYVCMYLFLLCVCTYVCTYVDDDPSCLDVPTQTDCQTTYIPTYLPTYSKASLGVSIIPAFSVVLGPMFGALVDIELGKKGPRKLFLPTYLPNLHSYIPST